jgi:hypothetical protein
MPPGDPRFQWGRLIPLAEAPVDSEADADAGVLFTATDGPINLAFLAGHIPRRCAS